MVETTNGNAEPPPPVPHAVPVLRSVPSAANVAHPGVPPADKTMRLVVVAFVVDALVMNALENVL